MPTPRPHSTTIAATSPTNGRAIPNRLPSLCARLTEPKVQAFRANRASSLRRAQHPRGSAKDRREHLDLAAGEAEVVERCDLLQQRERAPVLAGDRGAEPR